MLAINSLANKHKFKHHVKWIDYVKEKADLLQLPQHQNADSDSTIFVAISSYRDPELVPTLDNCWESAIFPNRLFFGILEQNDPEDSETCHAKNSQIPKSHLRIETWNYTAAKGPTVARHACEKLWNQEQVTLFTFSNNQISVSPYV